MRPLKLHTKTALLVSAITVTLLVVTLFMISYRMAGVVRDDQREALNTKAYAMAAHVSDTPLPRDSVEIGRAATLLKNQYPNIVTVRYWERAGGNFQPVIEADGSGPIEPIPEDAISALRVGQNSNVQLDLPSGTDGSRVRVFAPVTEPGRISGAVEVVEQLEPMSSIVWRYTKSAIWLSALAIALITLATYLLFRQLVYRPTEGLLYAMDRARAGDLNVQVPVRQDDELGRLSREFNNMIVQVREMTREREARHAILRERIAEATAELTKRNDELAEANVKQWQAMHRVGELERLAAAGQTAAQLAHEVGTPLNTISGHVQLLRAAMPDQPAIAKRITTISEQIERIERIVRQMLDRTRFPTLELQPVAVNRLLQDIIDAMAPALAEKQVTLDFRPGMELPPIVGDVDRLQQVFINLFNNALDAMPGGGELRVTTSVRDAGLVALREVMIEVADTGSGMTPEVLAHIFDPLYTTKKRGSGTGLGLVVVRQVIAEHRASIEVQSAPQEGATFTLTFPAATERIPTSKSPEAPQEVAPATSKALG
jgi:signal transduction histidine kinase